MHQPASLSALSARARSIWAVTGLPALVFSSGCDGEALNLGEDAPLAEQQEGTCSARVSSSGNLFVLNQAEVDALAGCRELPGMLHIRVPGEEAATFTLASLSELEVVHDLLSIVGPLTSLAGLESLQQVGSLELQGLRVPDLQPLRSLERSQRASDDTRLRGAIRIADCSQLRDLSGLENLTTWSSLSLTGLNGLVTLAGLQTPPRLEAIELSHLPLLTDVRELAPVRELGSLNIQYTAVERFEGFALQTAKSIFLYQNEALTDLDGLPWLRAIEVLSIQENPALSHIELLGLRDFQSISIIGNARLEAVPKYDINTGNWPTPEYVQQPVFGRYTQTLFEVGRNPLVSSIALPTEYFDVEQIAIYQNSSLTALDMGNLQRADNLWIQENAALAALVAPWLARVDDLSVLNNPELSVAPFANVQTFTRDVAGNRDELAP